MGAWDGRPVPSWVLVGQDFKRFELLSDLDSVAGSQSPRLFLLTPPSPGSLDSSLSRTITLSPHNAQVAGGARSVNILRLAVEGRALCLYAMANLRQGAYLIIPLITCRA
jgi:hypothetical protein